MTRRPARGRSLRTIYAPLATIILLALANWGVGYLIFDPLTAAQNPRLSFAPPVQTGPSLAPAIGRALVEPGSTYAVLTSPVPVNTPRTLNILFIGNSQSVAIMDMQPGDKLIPVWLAELLNQQGGSAGQFAVRLGSEPNLRMMELLIKSVLGSCDSEHRIDVLVAGIVLDGLRWVDPREQFVVLARDPDVRKDLEALRRRCRDLVAASHVMGDLLGSRLGSGFESVGSGGDTGPEQHSAAFGGQAEQWLQARLDARLALFGERNALYGYFLASFVAARNKAFGVSTSTRRPINEGMYSTNLEIIEAALRYLDSRGAHAVIYFAPIRPIEPNPYDPADIVRFRRDMEALCARHGAAFLDYSALVPEEMWTNYPDWDIGKGGQRDFAHFTGRAHHLLGERLTRDLRPSLDRWLEKKAIRLARNSADAGRLP